MFRFVQTGAMVVLVSVTCAVAGGGEKPLAVEAITEAVVALEYSDATAARLIAMVEGWKDPQGRMFLPALGKSLTRAREASQYGEGACEQLARAELGVARALGQCITRNVAYRRDYFDLNDVVGARQANCFGYAQLFCLLADATGLKVRVAMMTEFAGPALASVAGHVTNVVNLSDGTTVIVDLTRHEGFVGEPFATDKLVQGGKDVDDSDDLVGPAARDTEHGDRDRGPTGSPSASDLRGLDVLDHRGVLGEIHFSRGTVCSVAGRYQEALVYYARAIELNERSARAHNNRGAVYLLRAEYDRALADFDQAVRLCPRFAQAHQNRGSAYLGLGKYNRAVSDYTAAIGFYPDFSDAFFCRGFAYVILGRYAEGIDDYSRAIELDPTAARAYYRRGIARARIGQHEQARADLARAIELDHRFVASAAKVSDAYQLGLVRN